MYKAPNWKSAVNYLCKNDPRLAAVIKVIGPCRLSRGIGGFETLARTIIFQQLSLKAAGTIFSRVKNLNGTFRFNPASIVRLTDEQLRSAGVSRNKIIYLRDLCNKISAGKISFRNFPRMTDEQVRQALISVKGLGIWSADMYLIFVMNRPDILPTLDQGLRNGISLVYGHKVKKIPWAKLQARWSPYCSIASWYLWAYKNYMKDHR